VNWDHSFWNRSSEKSWKHTRNVQWRNYYVLDEVRFFVLLADKKNGPQFLIENNKSYIVIRNPYSQIIPIVVGQTK
jgi:hypothetical protein